MKDLKSEDKNDEIFNEVIDVMAKYGFIEGIFISKVHDLTAIARKMIKRKNMNDEKYQKAILSVAELNKTLNELLDENEDDADGESRMMLLKVRNELIELIPALLDTNLTNKQRINAVQSRLRKIIKEISDKFDRPSETSTAL